MANKIYDKVKKNIKENYKYYLFLIVAVFIMRFEFNYEVYSPGGLINLEDRIEIEGASVTKGSFNLTYVGGKRGILPVIVLSYVIPSWDLVSIEESQVENESYNDIYERGRILLNETTNAAIISSFKAANKPYEIYDEKVVVLHSLSEYKNNLKIGDEIISVNDKKLNNVEDISNFLNDYEEGDSVSVKIKRNNKEKTVTSIVKVKEEKKLIGVYLTIIKEVKTTPEVKINFKSSESGPSGGLMTALTIYNSLTETDITKGDKISGTGTIDEDGVVGGISGVKYKIKGAVNKKADVFIVPTENYEEAVSIKNEEKYTIEIIEAKTLEQVIQELKER